MWIISSKQIESEYVPQVYSGFYLYSDNSPISFESSKIAILYEGYILLRGNKSSVKSQTDEFLLRLVSSAFDPNMIKGNYTLLILEPNNFKIVSDRFGIQKWFYYFDGSDFFISNCLKSIVKVIKPKVSNTNMALYAITYHFVNGSTIYEGIRHNEPAMIAEFVNGKISISKYWNPLSLLEIKKQSVSISDIVHSLDGHIEELLQYSGDARISLSLTGGADTRNLLALLMKRNVKPHIYTYGDPLSSDCSKAKFISKGLGLAHDIYNIKLTEDIFRRYAKEIVLKGNSLSSIHRAHRLIAVEEESQKADVMFLGTLGGEFVKGVSEDYYIVPDVIFDNWTAKDLSSQQLVQYLKNKSVKSDSVNLLLLSQEISNSFLRGNVGMRKMLSLTNITAHLHDAQDLALYQTVMQYVFTPFLDIDYLETLFSSFYTFENKENVKSRVIRRIQNPIYASNFIRCAYPELGRFKYSGEHVPDEVLVNPLYAAIRKAIRQKSSGVYPPNFPLGRWMYDFVLSELMLCQSESVLSSVFDIDAMLGKLREQANNKTESCWLQYTNPIMMKYIIDEMEEK